jgi:hypothetical protein
LALDSTALAHGDGPVAAGSRDSESEPKPPWRAGDRRFVLGVASTLHLSFVWRDHLEPSFGAMSQAPCLR